MNDSFAHLNQLENLLKTAGDPETVMDVFEVQGFLYSIAITPDLIMPSEWLPLVFGEKSLSFKDTEQAQQMMGLMMPLYNTFIQLALDGKLSFPFDYSRIRTSIDFDDLFADVANWSAGFLKGLKIRLNIWGTENLNKDHIPDKHNILIVSLSAIETIVDPKYKNNYFVKWNEMIAQLCDKTSVKFIDNEKLEDIAFSMIPNAVDALTKYGLELNEQRTKGTPNSNSVPLRPIQSQPVRSQKIGRNEPCPCGSGKKFKKCCYETGEASTTVH